MLALVKKPRIELSVHGENTAELIAWIREKYDVTVLAEGADDEYVPIENTQYWKEMEKNRIGNLLAGARLKAGMSGQHVRPDLSEIVRRTITGQQSLQRGPVVDLSALAKIAIKRQRFLLRPLPPSFFSLVNWYGSCKRTELAR